MANRYSVASGNASAAATWDGGATVPVTGDRVLISAGHTVTLDGVFEWGDDANGAIVINGVNTDRSIWVAGTLKASRAVNSQLTCKGHIEVVATGTLDFGKSADAIPAGVTAKLLLNKSAVMANSKYGLDVDDGAAFWFYGAAKTRITTLTVAPIAGANQVTVADATGWNIGDRIALANDSSGADHSEMRTIAGTYAGGNVIPLTAALTFAHLNGLPLGNLDSNVSIAPVDINYPSWALLADNMTAGVAYREIRYASFEQLTGYPGQFGSAKNEGTTGSQSGLAIGSNNTANKSPYISVADIACFATISAGLGVGNVFAYMRRNYTMLPTVSRVLIFTPGNGASESGGLIWDGCLFCAGGPLAGGSFAGQVNNCWLSGRSGAQAAWAPANEHDRKFNNTFFCGLVYASIFSDAYINIECTNCDFGATFPVSSPVFRPRTGSLVCQTVLRDCKFGAGLLIVDPADWYTGDSGQGVNPGNYARVVNKNQDPSVQEEYLVAGRIFRDNAVNYSGANPSWRFEPRSTTVPLAKTLKVLAPYNGANPTLTVVSGRIKRDAGVGAVSVTLKGLGIVPSVYNCAAAAGVWEQFIVFATQTQGSSGVLDVEVDVLLGGGGTFTTDKCWVAEVSAPLAVAANSGSFQFWADAQPVSLMMSNAVGALDVMNVLLSQLTLPGSVGKAIAEQFRLQGLDPAAPLVVGPASRSAGAGISQSIDQAGGTTTVTRQ